MRVLKKAVTVKEGGGACGCRMTIVVVVEGRNMTVLK